MEHELLYYCSKKIGVVLGSQQEFRLSTLGVLCIFNIWAMRGITKKTRFFIPVITHSFEHYSSTTRSTCHVF